MLINIDSSASLYFPKGRLNLHQVTLNSPEFFHQQIMELILYVFMVLASNLT